MVRTTTGAMVAVDIGDLDQALGAEVASLRAELALIRSDREQELRSVRRLLFPNGLSNILFIEQIILN